MLPYNLNHTLVTGAFTGEIDLLKASGQFPHLEAMGIGNLEAAVQLSEYLSKNKNIRHIIFFGSCGAYEWSGISIGSFISPNRVYSKEISHALKISKQIPESPEYYETIQDKSLQNATCNAPTTITLIDLKQPPEESWKILEIENLELFGITKVAKKFSVTITAYLVVTNLVGPNGSSDWAKNWKTLSHSLQNKFLKVDKETT
ncbi:phosphorylase [Leptospira meyeri]|uniref:phosphorylase n=1 Tax=Leptospira meyeri TaxID=29508 RepID=UPI00034874A1|nr:phosphorylase [Leptospira meyeri]